MVVRLLLPTIDLLRLSVDPISLATAFVAGRHGPTGSRGGRGSKRDTGTHESRTSSGYLGPHREAEASSRCLNYWYLRGQYNPFTWISTGGGPHRSAGRDQGRPVRGRSSCPTVPSRSARKSRSAERSFVSPGRSPRAEAPVRNAGRENGTSADPRNDSRADASHSRISSTRGVGRSTPLPPPGRRNASAGREYLC